MSKFCPEQPLRIFIVGYPGCGKTTFIKELGGLLQSRGVNILGFYTEEIRRKGKRIGFRIVTWDGISDIFAHVEISSSIRVGKYGVSIKRFEKVAIPVMKKADVNSVVIIDEIGKMECASETFRQTLTNIINSDVHLIATLPIKGNDFIEGLKKRHSNSIFTLTRENYSQILDQILRDLSFVTQQTPFL